MRIALIAATLLIPLSEAASLTGAVVDQTGAFIPHAAVELDSGTRKYQVQGDDVGVYQFSRLPAGNYTLRFRVPGFRNRTIKPMVLLEREEKRIPDVTLDIAPCGSPSRDLILLPSGDTLGRLSGSVDPAVAGVEITLVCRTFTPCRSTRTDSSGRFLFEMLSTGIYGLNFRGDGFYPENATEYSYYVSAAWESVYDPKVLERCGNGNCDPKLRPKPPLAPCD